MKKVLTITLLVLLTVGLFVSCDADAIENVFPEETSPTCLAKGTLITMADGSKKAIETLKEGDLVKVFDHTTGQLSSSEIMDLWKYEEPLYGLMTLHFSNNIDISIVSAHSFYCAESKNYVYIDANNIKDYIGKHFYNAENNRWETLERVSKSNEKVETYFLATKEHFNCIAEGLLNVEDGVYFVICNTFEYDDSMKIDQEKKDADILEYGLFTYDDFKYLTREEFDSYHLAYLRIAIGKRIIDEKDLMLLEAAHYEYQDPSV